MSVRIAPAATLPHAERAALWTGAFSDYFTPGAFTAESLAAFEKAFDLDREGSRVAFEDDRPVAFAMLGIRGTRGWVGGMGVIPAARRRGHGESVMRAVIDAARERGLASLGLEVLVQNTPAIPLYEALGFRTLRKLEVWDRAADAAAPAPPSAPARAIAIDEAAARLGAERLARAPWQRDLAAARAAFPDLRALASADGRTIAIFRTSLERAGIVEVGAAPGTSAAARERGLDDVLGTIFHAPLAARLLNLPEGDEAGAALARAGLAVSHRQWEMELTLA